MMVGFDCRRGVLRIIMVNNPLIYAKLTMAPPWCAALAPQRFLGVTLRARLTPAHSQAGADLAAVAQDYGITQCCSLKPSNRKRYSPWSFSG
jgi:hypothetical protein